MNKLGMGGAPLGNLFDPIDETIAAATVSAAWDSGVRHFDTAPHYGAGLSEHRIGGVLRRYPATAIRFPPRLVGYWNRRRRCRNGRRVLWVRYPSGAALITAPRVPSAHWKTVCSGSAFRGSIPSTFTTCPRIGTDPHGQTDFERRWQVPLGC